MKSSWKSHPNNNETVKCPWKQVPYKSYEIQYENRTPNGFCVHLVEIFPLMISNQSTCLLHDERMDGGLTTIPIWNIEHQYVQLCLLYTNSKQKCARHWFHWNVIKMHGCGHFMRENSWTISRIKQLQSHRFFFNVCVYQFTIYWVNAFPICSFSNFIAFCVWPFPKYIAFLAYTFSSTNFIETQVKHQRHDWIHSKCNCASF